MPDRPYTIAPDSETEHAVQDLVRQVCTLVVQELDPEALLLSGSFGRGEGGAYVVDGALHTTSDLDLIVVYRGPASVWRTLLARRRVAAVTALMRHEFPGVSIDLTIRPAVLLSWPPATLDYYELLRSARVLHGAVRLPPPSAVRLDDIPLDERRRALAKRGVGLLVSWLRLASSDDWLTEAAARGTETEIDKAFLACGDTWLHSGGDYDHRLHVRMQRLGSLVTPSGSPSPLLRSQYEESGLRRLLPGPLVSRWAARHLQRWRGAAAEWTRAYELVRSGKHTGSTWHPWRHPARAVRHAMAVARQMVRGLPTPERQRLALPYLIRLAQGDREEAWLLQATATLLRAPAADRTDLVALVRRFLLAWNSDSLVVEPGLHPGVRGAHMRAGITGHRPDQLAPGDAHPGGCDAPTTQPDPARLVRRAGNAH
jgi:hypothetical protein